MSFPEQNGWLPPEQTSPIPPPAYIPPAAPFLAQPVGLQPPEAPIPEPEEPDILRMRTAGQAMDQQQYMTLLHRDAGMRRWIIAALYLLWAFFLLELYSIAVTNESGILALFSVCVLPIPLLENLVHRPRRMGRLKQQYTAYAVAYTGEVQTELYGDRLVQRSAQLCQTLFFSQETRLLEMGDLLLIYDADVTVILRATDITPEQAQRFYQYLCARIPKEHRLIQRPFYARRLERLPASPLPSPAVYTQFSFTRTKREDQLWVQRRSRAAVRERWLTLLAISLTAGGILAGLYTFTGNVLADTGLMTGVIFPPMLGLAYLASRWWCGYERKQRTARYTDHTVHTAVTQAGFVVRADGTERLILPVGLTVRGQDELLELESANDLMVIPWSAVPDTELLRQLLAAARK